MSGNPLCFIVFLFVFMSCTSQITVDENTSRLSEEELLTRVQEKTFQYFWEGAESNSGLARERIHLDEPDVDEHVVTTGGSGFGLMALIVGIEREFISREQGISRLSQIINFLDSADRFHGVWPHWLDGRTGKVIPFSPMDDGGDLVESSFLTSGLITVRQYLDQNNQEENELIQRINTMLNNVEWDWYTQGKETLYWHWSPNYDWHMNFAIDGYNECLITYVMAASSSEHGIAEGVSIMAGLEMEKLFRLMKNMGISWCLNITSQKNMAGHYSGLTIPIWVLTRENYKTNTLSTGN